MCFVLQTQQAFHGLWGHSDARPGSRSQRLAAKPRPLGEVPCSPLVYSGSGYGRRKRYCQGMSSFLTRQLRGQTLHREGGHCQRHLSSSNVILREVFLYPMFLGNHTYPCKQHRERQTARLCPCITHGPLGRTDGPELHYAIPMGDT